MKNCPCCNIKKPLSEFNKDRTKKTGVHNYCKVCIGKKYQEYRKTEKGQAKERRANWKKQNIDITYDEYRTKVAEQNGCCAICNISIDDSGWLCVDHRHEDGAVRGLLCRNCNLGVGNFKENEEILMKAIEYIRSHK